MAAPISFSEKLMTVFVPGQMEAVENASRSTGNMAWYGVSSAIVGSRNAFLVSATTAIISGGLALNSESGSFKARALGTIAGLSTVVAGLSGKVLFDSSKMFFLYVEILQADQQA